MARPCYPDAQNALESIQSGQLQAIIAVAGTVVDDRAPLFPDEFNDNFDENINFDYADDINIMNNDEYMLRMVDNHIDNDYDMLEEEIIGD